MPRKTILFTAWVGSQAGGEAETLRELLNTAFQQALGAARRKHGMAWKAWLRTGHERFKQLAEVALPKPAEALRALSKDELTAVLAGKHRRFVKRLAADLADRANDVLKAKKAKQNAEKGSFEQRALQRRINDLQSALSPWTAGKELRAVERYTGDERRAHRDRAATAFREVGPPWVLVASNIGAEGIDPHTYTTRIIHYDLERNPAKMEQREGRGDRVGRRLPDKLEVLYCLVPRTYDERMFHQLVARERWHGVLLGKPAAKLADEETQAHAPDVKHINAIRLRLSPG